MTRMAWFVLVGTLTGCAVVPPPYICQPIPGMPLVYCEPYQPEVEPAVPAPASIDPERVA